MKLDKWNSKDLRSSKYTLGYIQYMQHTASKPIVVPVKQMSRCYCNLQYLACTLHYFYVIYLFKLLHIRKSFQVSCLAIATVGFTLFHANFSNEIWTLKYVSKEQVYYLQLIDKESH